ncbi:unnamed protein product [Heligmosomoides polygyrus]|uniref:von Hippel-Lindau disease tumor suppressor n=1 Tax=Heligmosomoides polygyrus TaxID=6339 RepID=A0A183FW38_HELPZ|nr:unnamed protein product [Heligmosomoides polygyrus]
MSSDSPLTGVDNTATCSWESVRYVFRQMRTPSTRSRHLTEADTEVIRHISDSHYFNKLTRQIDHARVARRQKTPTSSSSSSSTEHSSPGRLESVSSDESTVFFYQNQHVRDDLPGEGILHRYSDGVSFATMDPEKGDTYRSAPRRSARATSITLRRFGRNIFILNDKVGHITVKSHS